MRPICVITLVAALMPRECAVAHVMRRNIDPAQVATENQRLTIARGQITKAGSAKRCAMNRYKLFVLKLQADLDEKFIV